MTKTYLLLLVLSLFVVAYVPRLFPMLLFYTRKVPSWFSEWMKYVPVALFAALAFKDVFITHEHLDIAWNIKVLAMVLVAGVAYKSTLDGFVGINRISFCISIIHVIKSSPSKLRERLFIFIAHKISAVICPLAFAIIGEILI